MYTIRQVAELTGFSPDTLRYYEKTGLLKPTQRGPGGTRAYSEDNMHVLSVLKCLKKTGLSLDDIKVFIQESHLLESSPSAQSGMPNSDTKLVLSRIKILSEHLQRMEEQRRELDELINRTQQKLHFYNELLNT